MQLTVGRHRATERAEWEAGARWVEAERASARLTHAQRTRSVWLEGWVGYAVATHLDELAIELEERLTPLRAATERGLFPAAALADVELELALLRQEAGPARLAAADAEVSLSSLLGAHVVIDPVDMPDLHEEPIDPTDPWVAARARVEAHPELRALEARRELVAAEGRAAASETPALVGVGTTLRGGAEGSYAVPLLTVQVPLSNPGAPVARERQAEARAVDAERERLLQRLVASLDASSRAWTVAIARLEHLVEDTERPLQARYERLRDAFVAGSVDAVPVMLAVRDLHEAHHAHALAVADLYRRRAEAEALTAQLSEESP